MQGIVKLMVALTLGAALCGCVVAPAGRPRAYVRVVTPAPVVVVRGGYYYRAW